MGECFSKAAQLTGTLDGTNWEIFEAVARLTDERKAQADAIRSAVQPALMSDEHVIGLGAALKDAQSRAVRLLTVTTTPPRPEPGLGPRPPELTPPKPGKKVVSQNSRENLGVKDVRQLLGRLEEEVQKNQSIRLNVSWVIEEEGGAL
jgi:hypothetical protein